MKVHSTLVKVKYRIRKFSFYIRMVSELYGIKVKKSISNYSFYDLLTGKQHKQRQILTSNIKGRGVKGWSLYR